MATTPQSRTMRCGCGATIARVSYGIDAVSELTVCPHVPHPALAVTPWPAGTGEIARTVRALEAAARLLFSPCSDCHCRTVLVGDLEPDPDCPGLAGDGCRADVRIRAWTVLLHAGIPYRAHSLRYERSAIASALEHAHFVLAEAGARTEALEAAAPTVVITAPAPAAQDGRCVA